MLCGFWVVGLRLCCGFGYRWFLGCTSFGFLVSAGFPDCCALVLCGLVDIDCAVLGCFGVWWAALLDALRCWIEAMFVEFLPDLVVALCL